MPLPSGVLLCAPDHFDVVDVKNPFMEGKAGTVDRDRARRQWEALRETWVAAGAEVSVMTPTPGCEDMVFCANPVFTGPGICVLSRMRHESRQNEVPAFAPWFHARGDLVVTSSVYFEGGGDALWHPGRARIWCGFGQRSAAGAPEVLARVFDAEVIGLELPTPDFYHLDTCFCPLDEETALVYPPALTSEGLASIDEHFPRLIEVSREDAYERLACNAAVFLHTVVLQAGADELNALLRALGYDVRPVEIDEFLKSGGGVACMRQPVWS